MGERGWGVATAVVVSFVAVGCAGPMRRTGEWPLDLPAEAHFTAVYDVDEGNAARQSVDEYLGWVLRFYKGSGLVPGWRSQEEALAKLLGDDHAAFESRIVELGRMVAGEWAKDNAVRRIDSDMLMLWGNLLKRAAKERRIAEVLERVVADVGAVAAGGLAKAEITKSRYVAVMAMK